MKIDRLAYNVIWNIVYDSNWCHYLVARDKYMNTKVDQKQYHLAAEKIARKSKDLLKLQMNESKKIFIVAQDLLNDIGIADSVITTQMDMVLNDFSKIVDYRKLAGYKYENRPNWPVAAIIQENIL